MLTFALDTALSSCSVAIISGDEVLSSKFQLLAKGHAEILPVMAAETFQEAGVTPSDLDRVVVVIGPGGFTGLRIGLSFARGLALGQKAKVVGVNSLEALAAAHTGHGQQLIAPIVDARRGEVYSALFDQELNCLVSPFIATPEGAREQLKHASIGRELLIVGSGGQFVKLQGVPCDDNAQHIDPIVLARIGTNKTCSDVPPSPIYLRAPDAAPGAKSSVESLFESLRIE